MAKHWQKRYRHLVEHDMVKLPALTDQDLYLIDPSAPFNLVPSPSLLIDNLLANIPLPPLIFIEVGLKRKVIDGHKRLRTLRAFFGGDFRLFNMVLHPELEGLHYKTLPLEARKLLHMKSIDIRVLIDPDPQILTAVYTHNN